MQVNKIKYFLFCLAIIGLTGIVFFLLFSRDNNLAKAEVKQSGVVEDKKVNDSSREIAADQKVEMEWSDVTRVPDEIYKFFPLAVGNKWEYKGDEKTAFNNKAVQGPSDFVKTVKSIKQNGDNFVVSIFDCRGQQNITFPGRCFEDLLYINGNKICDDIKCKETRLEFPLASQKVMDSESYTERVAKGFDDKRYVWNIGKKIPTVVLGKRIGDCFSVEYLTLPDESRDIFCYGIGFVKNFYDHHGTPDTVNEKLVNFTEVK